MPKEETVSIRRNFQSAKSIKFWQTSILPFSNQPIDWLNLFRIGKEVKSEDSIEVHPDKITAYFLVAQGQLGISGYRQIVEVPSHEEPIAADIYECKPMEKMASKPHIARIDTSKRKSIDSKEVQITRPPESWCQLKDLQSPRSI